MDWKNKSLIDALANLGVRALPEKDNGEDIWLKAIALVTKRDGTRSYVAVEKKPTTLENVIVKDYGSIAQIVKIEEYYPYSFLKANYIPTFKTKSKEERIVFLSKYTKQDYSTMTLKELDKEVLKRAIITQLNNDK